MGAILKKLYHSDYFSVGFDFNKGGFLAVDITNPALKAFKVSNALNNSTGAYFSMLKIPQFFINIDAVVDDRKSLNYLFTKKIKQRSIGAGFNAAKENDYYVDEPICKEFNGLIFVNEITYSLPLEN